MTAVPVSFDVTASIETAYTDALNARSTQFQQAVKRVPEVDDVVGPVVRKRYLRYFYYNEMYRDPVTVLRNTGQTLENAEPVLLGSTDQQVEVCDS